MTTLIIGAGPAGSACALWLHQLGCPVLLVDKNPQAGGLQQFSPYQNVWIPSVLGRRGMDVAAALDEHLRSAGVPLRFGAGVAAVQRKAGGFLAQLDDGSRLEVERIVLATGAKFKTGGFTPSERLSIGPGRGFEAMEVAGRRLAILGGGDNAFDAYNFARQRGVGEARIFARTLRAQKKLQGLVPAEHVVVGPFEVNAQAGTVNGEVFDCISVQFGFEAQVPAGFERLERTPEGYVKAAVNGVTSEPGVFAAGEVANTLHPCVTTSFAHGIQVAKLIQALSGL